MCQVSDTAWIGAQPSMEHKDYCLLLGQPNTVDDDWLGSIVAGDDYRRNVRLSFSLARKRPVRNRPRLVVGCPLALRHGRSFSERHGFSEAIVDGPRRGCWVNGQRLVRLFKLRAITDNRATV